MSSRCDRNSGCLLGQVIRHLGSASTCRRNLESVSSRLVTGTSFTNPEISGLFFFLFFFSFSSSGKCFIIIFVSRLSRPSLYHATWLLSYACLIYRVGEYCSGQSIDNVYQNAQHLQFSESNTSLDLISLLFSMLSMSPIC